MFLYPHYQTAWCRPLTTITKQNIFTCLKTFLIIIFLYDVIFSLLFTGASYRSSEPEHIHSHFFYKICH